REVVDARPDLGDCPTPLVARNAGEADPARIELAREHLEVGAAHARRVAANEHVARPDHGLLDVAERRLPRALEDNRLHLSSPRPRPTAPAPPPACAPRT